MPFPYTDRLADKRRPVLVVSSGALAEAGYVWVVMITSARSGFARHDVSIDDLAMAGLSAPCVVRPSKIACIEPGRILRRTGRLPASLTRRVVRRIRTFLPSASPRAS